MKIISIFLFCMKQTLFSANQNSSLNVLNLHLLIFFYRKIKEWQRRSNWNQALTNSVKADWTNLSATLSKKGKTIYRQLSAVGIAHFDKSNSICCLNSPITSELNVFGNEILVDQYNS